MITNKIDMCLISETLLDLSFPNLQFLIHECKIFRRNWDKYGAGILFNVNENIPSKVLHLNSNPKDNDVILLKFSIRGLKRLCIGVYKAQSQNDKYFPNNLSKNLVT